MDFSFSIAARIASGRGGAFSGFIVRMSTVATSVSVAAMIVAVCCVEGFQRAVADKVFSFWGHIHVQPYQVSKSLVAEDAPIQADASIEAAVTALPEVARTHAFVTKSGVLEKSKAIEGVVVKGIDAASGRDYIAPFLKQGSPLDFSDPIGSKGILVPSSIANALNIRLGDTVTLHFILGKSGEGDASVPATTYRKARVQGIFATGIEEYDKNFVLCDIRLLQRLNSWEGKQIGGYEVFLKNHRDTDTVNAKLKELLPLDRGWDSRTIKETFPNIFDWLAIQDTNRNIVFVIMAIVAIINMATCLLVLVLERVRMVGTLKALGATDWQIQKIFLFQAARVSAFGIGIGTLLGTGLCLLQRTFRIIPLDEAAYYIDYLPVAIDPLKILATCAATLAVCLFSLLAPTLIIRRILPVDAIRFR